MSELTQRPRLDPWPHTIAPGPLSPAWREPPRPDLTPWPEAVGPETPTPELEALERKLAAFRAECYAALRAGDDSPVSPVGHADLVALNRILAGVKSLNAALHHPSRSRAVAAWPDPVLPQAVILGPRDLVGVLDSAIRVVSSALSERGTWIFTHG